MNQEKVLIVEDEENERTGLAELISAWGYRTDSAADGLEGLEKAVAWSPSVVITDLKMPRMTGMELLERIGEQVPVIVFTGQGNVEEAVSAMKLHAYDFIEKPLNPSRIARLKNVIQKATQQRQDKVEK